jgi:hypothetical protein
MKYSKRGCKYPKDYVSYWNSKGDYGKERVKRMRLRKQKRFEKWSYRERHGTWTDPYTGKLMQHCEWPEGSSCEYPCNGDC